MFFIFTPSTRKSHPSNLCLNWQFMLSHKRLPLHLFALKKNIPENLCIDTQKNKVYAAMHTILVG